MTKLTELLRVIASHNGLNDKAALTTIICARFGLTRDRSVYYCSEFAVRFCSAKGTSFSNTVLSLSNLQKVDHLPFLVCVVTPQENRILLANTTMLRKVSHSSHELRVDNIKGSFNGSDILREFEGIPNTPENIERLFNIHAGEMGVATTGFLLGHALWLDRGPLARRLARLWPHAVLVALWQAIYSLAGYGVAASGAYVNPLREPMAFLAKLVERAPVLVLGQLTPVSADFWGMYPTAVKVTVFALALGLLVAFARVAWPRLATEQRQSSFWLVGVGLSLALICASGPQDRNLVFVGFGVAPLLAIAFARLVEAPPIQRWRRSLASTLAVFNLALAPVLLPIKCLAILGIAHMFLPVDNSIPRDPAITGKTLVVVWTQLEPAVYYSWSLRDHGGIPRPGRTRILATSREDVSITRLDEVTLRLHPGDGFFASEASKLFRSASNPFSKGDTVELSNTKATVTEVTVDGRPATVDFRFSAPLESPEWLWMRGSRQGLVKWMPPKVGETVMLAVLEHSLS